jgi:hypothetical protein
MTMQAVEGTSWMLASWWRWFSRHVQSCNPIRWSCAELIHRMDVMAYVKEFVSRLSVNWQPTNCTISVVVLV